MVTYAKDNLDEDAEVNRENNHDAYQKGTEWFGHSSRYSSWYILQRMGLAESIIGMDNGRAQRAAEF